MNKTKDITLAIFPEGPIAHNGSKYCYSKGERYYIDRLAEKFKKVVLVTCVLREGDEFYDACCHSEFESENVEVFELPFKGNAEYSVAGKLLHFIKVFFAMFRIIPKIDISYLFLPSYPSAIAWAINKLMFKPHIVYAADDWEQASAGMFKWDNLRGSLFYKIYYNLNRVMESAIARTAIFSVTAGGQLAKKYRKFKKPVQETTPRMTFSTDDVVERKDTCQSEKIRVLNVGNLVYDKAQHTLIEALPSILEKHPNVEIHIAGMGPREDELKSLAKQLGVTSSVVFLGYVENETELYNIYRGADIFALTSVSEGFPRVLYEAMGMGLPVITTDCGGITNLMQNRENAIVISTENAEDCSRAICEVIENSELRQKLIQAGNNTITQVLANANPHQIADLLEHNLAA